MSWPANFTLGLGWRTRGSRAACGSYVNIVCLVSCGSLRLFLFFKHPPRSSSISRQGSREGVALRVGINITPHSITTSGIIVRTLSTHAHLHTHIHIVLGHGFIFPWALADRYSIFIKRACAWDENTVMFHCRGKIIWVKFAFKMAGENAQQNENMKMNTGRF